MKNLAIFINAYVTIPIQFFSLGIRFKLKIQGNRSKSLDNQSKQGGNGIIRFGGRARSPSRAKSTKSKASVGSSPPVYTTPRFHP